jgi:hypothetical protein
MSVTVPVIPTTSSPSSSTSPRARTHRTVPSGRRKRCSKPGYEPVSIAVSRFSCTRSRSPGRDRVRPVLEARLRGRSGLVPEDAIGLVGPHHLVGLDVPPPGADLGDLLGRLQPFGPLVEARLELLSFGDVSDDSGDPDDVARAVRDRFRSGANPPPVLRFRIDPELDIDGLAVGGALRRPSNRLAILGIDTLEERRRVLREAPDGSTEHLRVGGVDEQEFRPVGAEDTEDAVGRSGQLAEAPIGGPVPPVRDGRFDPLGQELRGFGAVTPRDVPGDARRDGLASDRFVPAVGVDEKGQLRDGPSDGFEELDPVHPGQLVLGDDTVELAVREPVERRLRVGCPLDRDPVPVPFERLPGSSRGGPAIDAEDDDSVRISTHRHGL